jgi:imidazolonepropionase-like amidohydrolase
MVRSDFTFWAFFISLYSVFLFIEVLEMGFLHQQTYLSRRLFQPFSTCNWGLLCALLSTGCGAASGVIDETNEQATTLCLSEEPSSSETGHEHQSASYLINGATILTANGERFESGHLLMENGRIRALGEGEIEAPDDETVLIDGTGRFITPGIIDTHSHLGVYPTPHVRAHSDGNEATASTTPYVQALHSVWPQDPGFFRAIAGGVTAMQILPGSANLIGGRGVTIKLHRGARVPEEMRFPDALDGLKMACGENPKRVYGGRGSLPSTRMGSISVMRQVWAEATEYREQQDRYEDSVNEWCEVGAAADEQPDAPPRNLGMETLASVLEGDILVHIHCYRADEMMVQMQIADEFGFEIRSFHHAIEAYKIRDHLALQEIAVSTWADWWGFKIEAFDAILENAGLLTESGARAIIHSDSAIGIQRLNQEAGKAYYSAISSGVDVTEDEAIQWITLNPAWALGVDHETGSLEIGKMADVVLWSDHPFSVYSTADLVFVDGEMEYDSENNEEPWSDFELGLDLNEGGQ